MTADFNPEMLQLAEKLNETMAEAYVLRPKAEVERFFDGLEPVPPGVVQVGAWQQGGAPAAEPGPVTTYYVGVDRKP